MLEENSGLSAPGVKDPGKICDCPKPNNNRNNPKKVIATDCDTNEEKIYRSTYAAFKDLDINSGLIKMCCEGKN